MIGVSLALGGGMFIPSSGYTFPGPYRILLDGDSTMANPGFRDLLLTYLGNATYASDAHNFSTGGHTVVDMLNSAPEVINEIEPGSTIVVVGPIGANREPGATVEDHEVQIAQLYQQYVDAGAIVIGVPTLPDGMADASDVDPHGNDAYYAATAQITRDLADASPKIYAADVSAFDPVSMKNDRTHPNVAYGAAYLAGAVKQVVDQFATASRLDEAPNLLGAAATFPGAGVISGVGVSGVQPDDWMVARLVGTGDWTISRDAEGSLLCSITNAPDRGILQLKATVPYAAAAGDVFDAVFEVEVVSSASGFNGFQASTITDTLLGNINEVAIENPPAHPVYPRAQGVGLPSSVTEISGALRLGCAAGGSVTYRLRRASLFFVENVGSVLTISGTPNGVVARGADYDFVPVVEGGVAPYSFALEAGALPAGLSLDTDTGAISGTALAVETQGGITIGVTDADGTNATLSPFSIDVISTDAPQNTVLPSVSGTPEAGQVLTVDPGTWTDTPTGFTYQWLVSGNIQAGQTGISFAVDLSHVGQTISCEVVASNANGSSSPARSAETATVTNPVTAAVVSLDSTLNSPDGLQLTYSDSDRIVAAGPLMNGVRHTRGLDLIQGRKYFEIAVTSQVLSIGVSTDGVTYISGGPNGTGRVHWAGALVYRQGGTTNIGARSEGDLVQIAVDQTSGLIWFRTNGTGDWNGDPAASPTDGIGGISISGLTSVYPYLALKRNASAAATLHGSSDRLQFTPPTGFDAIG